MDEPFVTIGVFRSFRSLRFSCFCVGGGFLWAFPLLKWLSGRPSSREQPGWVLTPSLRSGCEAKDHTIRSWTSCLKESVYAERVWVQSHSLLVRKLLLSYLVHFCRGRFCSESVGSYPLGCVLSRHGSHSAEWVSGSQKFFLEELDVSHSSHCLSCVR